MAFNILGWSIQGFRSFARDSVFSVPALAGLYSIEGRNLESPEKGANGTGKSTIADALVWVFYGKTVCGLRGPQIKSWIADEPTVVSVDFEIDERLLSITRTQDPNSLNLRDGGESRVVDQEYIDQLIGMTMDQFLATVVLSAWGRPFLELGATDRLNALSRVLRLDQWETKAKSAKDLASAGDRVLLDMEKDINKILSEIDTREDTIERSKGSLRVWESDRAARVQKLLRLISAAEKDLSVTYNALRAIEVRHIEGIEEAERMKGEIAPFRSRIEVAEKELVSAKKDHDRLLNKKKDLQDAVTEVQSLSGSECPCCRQHVRSYHVDKAVDSLMDSIESLEKDIKRAHTAVQEKAHLVEVLKSRVFSLEKGHALKSEACRAIDAERRMTISKIEIMQERLRSQKSEVGALQAEVCPHNKMIEDQTLACKAARDHLASIESMQREEAKRVSCLQELHKIFKDIRLSVCEEAMHSFSASMSSALEQLGLVGWRVEASLDRPTKKGEGVRGFQLLIQSPDSPEWVPWETWSGGERQRLLLAGSVAFSDITCTRLGVTPSLEIWDEPTNHLSAQGIEDLSYFLKDRSTIKDRVILFIDHRTLDFGVFDGCFTVQMDKFGSCIL